MLSSSPLLARPDHVQPVLPPPSLWRRDAALLGGLAALGVNLGILMLDPEAWSSAVLLLGALSGALMGGVIHRQLDSLRRRRSLWRIGLRMLGLGALWGTLLALSWGTIDESQSLLELLPFAVLMGGTLGAVLVGTLWLPYTIAAVMRLPRWPVMLATLLLSSVLTWAGSQLIIGAWLALLLYTMF